MKNKYSLLLILLLFSGLTYSQTASQREQITDSYNKEKLKNLADYFQKRDQAAKEKAIQMAKQKNWPVTYEKDGNYYELMEIAEEGSPLYYQTYNVDAAISTRTNTLHNGGLLGLNLEGDDMVAYIWDGGIARATHQEYDGPGGNNRYSVGDGTEELHDHSGHVAGTIIASGVDANAKGMAPRADAIGYNWTNDRAEATDAAGDGMLLSNHSYGWVASSIPDWYFGAYLTTSRDWDEVMFNAPYYLMVKAAGNDGEDDVSNGDPLDNESAYDKLSGIATCKNNLVVANGEDADIDDDGNLISVNRRASSSEGPTDDYRIKPDIMGNGTGLYSTLTSNDQAYGFKTGTSMASPNICGTLLLLQEYYHDLNNVYMRAATLKGLALHTADDAGPEGPDAQCGWGLMNAKEAARTIMTNGSGSIISELTLNDGESYTIDVVSDGTNPLIVSISWTDPAGVARNNSNDHSAVLVNDLDLRVKQNQDTYYPYRLISVSNYGLGDNDVDPYEKVVVENANGTYTITVNHEGDLENDQQAYSLIITGIVGAPVANFTADNVTPDVDETVSFTDQSLNNPTSWEWSFSPTTVTYVNETNHNSQNPQVQFNEAGDYSVTLIVSNEHGSDTLTKTDYISVTVDGCPAINVFPYSQNYDAWDKNNPTYNCTDDGSLELPDCWINETGDDFDWNIFSGSTASSNTGPEGDHTSGNGKYLYVESSRCFEHTGYLLSPVFDLSGLDVATLTFWYHMYGASMGELSVQISTDGGTNWSDNVWSLSGNQGNEWKEATVSLNDYLVNNVVIRFKAVTGSSYTSDIAIDDFEISEEENQEPEYCQTSYSTGTKDGDFVSLVRLEDIDNATEALADSPYYIYYDNLSTDLTIGNTYTLTVSAGTYDSENNIAAWIDFDHNGTFEADEKLGQVELNDQPETGDMEFTVPDDAYNGTTRLRVRESWRTDNIDPCDEYRYGETEDYNVHLVAARQSSNNSNEDDFAIEMNQEKINTNSSEIYAFNKTIFVNYTEESAGEIYVYSLTGNVVAHVKAVRGLNKIKVAVNQRFYVVQVISPASASVKKVYIK